MMGRMTCARAFEYVVHPLGSSLSSHSLCSCAPTAVHNILITGGDRLDTNRAIFAERASGRQNVIGALLPGILLLLGILWWKHSSGAVRGKSRGICRVGDSALLEALRQRRTSTIARTDPFESTISE